MCFGPWQREPDYKSKVTIYFITNRSMGFFRMLRVFADVFWRTYRGKNGKTVYRRSI